MREEEKRHTTMITGWQRCLSMERSLFSDCADSTDPMIVYNLVIVPNTLLLLLFLGFLRDNIFGSSTGRTRVGRNGVVTPDTCCR